MVEPCVHMEIVHAAAWTLKITVKLVFKFEIWWLLIEKFHLFVKDWIYFPMGWLKTNSIHPKQQEIIIQYIFVKLLQFSYIFKLPSFHFVHIGRTIFLWYFLQKTGVIHFRKSLKAIGDEANFVWEKCSYNVFKSCHLIRFFCDSISILISPML